MLIKSILLSFFLLESAFALVEFPQGKCDLEGKLHQKDGHWYFTIHPETNSAIRLHLAMNKGNETSRMVKARILFKKKMNSYAGEAELEKIINDLNPYREPLRYNSKNIKKFCLVKE